MILTLHFYCISGPKDILKQWKKKTIKWNIKCKNWSFSFWNSPRSDCSVEGQLQPSHTPCGSSATPFWTWPWKGTPPEANGTRTRGTSGSFWQGQCSGSGVHNLIATANPIRHHSQPALGLPEGSQFPTLRTFFNLIGVPFTKANLLDHNSQYLSISYYHATWQCHIITQS